MDQVNNLYTEGGIYMKKRLNNKGMTLVEIVVSMTIFAIMSIAFLNIFFGSYLINLRAESRTEIIGEVSGEMENKLSGSTMAGISGNATIMYNGSYTTSTPGMTVTDTQTDDKGQSVSIT